MIIKFPFLYRTDANTLRHWLDKQFHEAMSWHHKYESCGNTEEAVRHKARAETFRYIQMMMHYHMEDQ